MRLADKVAIVTGAGSGFGEGIARRLAGEGAAVVVADIRAEPAGRVADAIRAQGGRAVPVVADVSVGEGFAATVEAALGMTGRLDIVVNNAGVPQRSGPMELVDEATFDRIFAVNVKPLYWTAVHAVPAMRRTGGAVVNIASASAERPRPGLAWYGGSKGAVLTLTRTMAIELAGQGIRVNAVTPVAGDTPMLDQFLGGDGDRGTADPALRERFISSIPLGRLCRPADVAEATLFLASGEASFVTGISLPVDGGRCI